MMISCHVYVYSRVYYKVGVVIFFFKQKTAYEIQYGLVGSEMCIRDRGKTILLCANEFGGKFSDSLHIKTEYSGFTYFNSCLLYTSDAADERSSVDLGGRRIIKKKTRDILDGCKDIDNRYTPKIYTHEEETEII